MLKKPREKSPFGDSSVAFVSSPCEIVLIPETRSNAKIKETQMREKIGLLAMRIISFSLKQYE